jgi:ABC-type spermidine/putrescine transport system permease subunit II
MTRSCPTRRRSASGTASGYGFGRFRFRGAGAAFGLVLLGLMIPFQAVLTPLFLELHFLHLLNSLMGLSRFYTAFNLPFGVYVMRNSFLAVPKEIINAARVDGASTMRTLVSVLRPLIRPGVATTTLYAFGVLLDGVPRRADPDDRRRAAHHLGGHLDNTRGGGVRVAAAVQRARAGVPGR